MKWNDPNGNHGQNTGLLCVTSNTDNDHELKEETWRKYLTSEDQADIHI